VAEIEPNATPTSVATEAVAGAPVPPYRSDDVPPVEGAVPPPGAPVRPRGLVRWGVAVGTLAVVVGVVSIAVVLLAAGSVGSAIRGWLPPDTVAYLEVRADLPGDQRSNVADLLARFPGFADRATLETKIDETIERLLDDSGVRWTQDVKPWFGGEFGLVVTSAIFDAAAELDEPGPFEPAAPPEDGAALLVAVRDAAAASAWVATQVEGDVRTETYAGGELTLVAGPEGTMMAFAARNDVLVLGGEGTVRAVLDTGGASRVGDSEPFAAGRRAAPGAYLGFGYVDLAAFIDGALEAAGEAAELPQACLDEALAAAPAWAVGSVRAEDDLLAFTSTVAEVGERPATAATASVIAEHLPDTTVVALGTREFGPSLLAWLDRLERLLTCDPEAAEIIDQLLVGLAAFGGADALAGWAGDAAFALDFGDRGWTGGFAATAADEAAAGRALQQVRSILALAGAGGDVGIQVREEPYGEGALLLIEVQSDLAGEEAPAFAATVQGGVFAVGTVDFVKGVVDTERHTSLAATDAYRRAVSAAGGTGVSEVFVHLAGLAAGVETMVPTEEQDRFRTEVKPYLEPLEAFVALAGPPGETTESRAVITFTK
jgi:hypothetical protein